ncbi:MAG: cellulose biosynthesis protein BcsR [Sinimarinibacterium flocculans]|uniref:cellulose biosynthesis protein BcsR n=1 Tax=Sinimarinibacterium flocculans TaxID=985250 RepID=UPI003517D536
MQHETDPPAADDIATLQRRLAMEPRLAYVDLSRDRALAQALGRWPWLEAVRERHRPEPGTGPA